MSQYQLRERLAYVIAKKHKLSPFRASKILLNLNPKNAIQAYKTFVLMNEAEKYQRTFFF